jgi:hypothetical protein
MTAISIHDFHDRAWLGDRGEIRVAREDESRLNRGTLGECFVSWIRDVKELFGKRDETRVERQRQALESFRTALTAYYGEEIGTQAFLAQGLGLPGRTTALTGGEVRAAIERAQTLAAAGRLRIDGALNPLLPRHQAFPDFVQQVLGGEAPQLTDQEHREYETRLRGRVGALDPRTARPEEIRAIAEATLRAVRTLSEQGELGRAGAAREGLAFGLKKVLKGLRDEQEPFGRVAQDTLEWLAGAARDWLDQARIEGVEDPKERKALARAALFEVMRELGEDGQLLLDLAHRRALSEPWRAVRERVRQQDGVDWRGIGALLDLIVEGLGTERGALTGSVAGDLALLRQGQVSEEARRAVAGTRGWLAGPRRVLGEIKRAFGEQDRRTGEVRWLETEGRPSWDSVALFEQLERSVGQHAKRGRISIPEAIRQVRQALARDPHLAPELSQKLALGLTQMEREQQLGALLGCPAGSVWRLIHPPEPSKWSYLRQEPRIGPFQGGALRGLGTMLDWEQGALDGFFGLAGFRAALGQAESDEAKRSLIAQALQDAWAIGHLPSPVLTQILLQRLLRDAGLPPALALPLDEHGDVVLTAEAIRRAQIELRMLGESELLHGLFSAHGRWQEDRWVVDREIAVDGQALKDFRAAAIDRVQFRAGEEAEQPLAPQFHKDIQRSAIVVHLGDRPVQLDLEGAATTLGKLVETGDEEKDPVAVRQLSRLLNQEIINELGLRASQHVLGDGVVLLGQHQEGLLEIDVRRVESENGPVIEIDFRIDTHCELLDHNGQQGRLDNRTDLLTQRCGARIPLSALQEGDLSRLELQPVLGLHLESTGAQIENGAPTHLTFVERGNRQVATLWLRQEIRDARRGLEQPGGAPPELPLEIDPVPLQLEEGGLQALRRLVDPQTLDDFLAAAKDKLGLGDVELPRHLTVTPREDTIEIEFRYRLPDGFPGDNVVLHGRDGPPPQVDGFDMVLRLGISRKDLETGHPERFTLEGPEVEAR